MNARHVSFCLVATIAAALAPSFVRAQSIYKCPLPGGGYQYTDVACTGPEATVVHKATAGEVAAKLNADDRQAIVSMLRNNRVEDAKRYAVAHHQEVLYNSIINSLVREKAVAEQRREQRAELEREQRAQAVQNRMQSLAAQNQDLQQQVNAQAQALELQKQRASQARRQARSAKTLQSMRKMPQGKRRWMRRRRNSIPKLSSGANRLETPSNATEYLA